MLLPAEAFQLVATTTLSPGQDLLDTRQSNLLKICMFATGCSGIVAEFTLSTLASYLLGNTTLQWTLTMSVMLFAMGLGSRWSRLLPDRLLDRFIAIEFWLSRHLRSSCVFRFGLPPIRQRRDIRIRLFYRLADRHGDSPGCQVERDL
ncbi:MAG: hypothetical protein O3B73_14895 [bacterium]|nr:hypothetical protein [bacterium]